MYLQHPWDCQLPYDCKTKGPPVLVDVEEVVVLVDVVDVVEPVAVVLEADVEPPDEAPY